MDIRQTKDLLLEEKKELAAYQRSSNRIVKTQRPYLDDTFGGLLPGDVVTIAAGAGVGKSYELNIIKNNVMDININPDANEYVFLDVSLEMRLFSLMIRQLSYGLNKSKKEILLKQFSESEKQKAADIISKWEDERFFISQTPTTPQQFYEQTNEFCMQHVDKKAIFITCDHLALLSGSAGKTSIIEEFLLYINELKMSYKNVYFFLVSQLNSNYFGRIAEEDRMSEPKPTDLFYSNSIFHLSSYVMVIANPSKLGIVNYSSVIPERYPHLEKYFTEPNKKGKVSFDSEGLLFYHLLKNREGETNYTDLFVHELFEKQFRPVKQEVYISKEAKEIFDALGGMKRQDLTESPFI